MTYSIYSFVALSPLRHDARPEKTDPPGQQKPDAGQSTDALRLKGSARISGIPRTCPWYVRLFPRLLGSRSALAVQDRFEFELVFKANPQDSSDGNPGLADLRKHLGLAPDVESAIIEVFVRPDRAFAPRIDQVEKPSEK